MNMGPGPQVDGREQWFEQGIVEAIWEPMEKVSLNKRRASYLGPIGDQHTLPQVTVISNQLPIHLWCLLQVFDEVN